MPSWTEQQRIDYERRQAISKARRVSPRSELEPIVRHEPVGEARRESPYPERIHVVVTSFRRRLCDPDNLCPKYFIDCLRYAGLIRDDTGKDIVLTVKQEQVCRPENERTEIELHGKDLNE